MRVACWARCAFEWIGGNAVVEPTTPGFSGHERNHLRSKRKVAPRSKYILHESKPASEYANVERARDPLSFR